jgi:exodeoxyribonuclease-3
VKIATWNVNSLRVRLPQVLDWLAAESPDVLALQETKVPDADFPASAFADAGYEVSYNGQKTYNGVATVYRGEAANAQTDLPDLEDPQRRFLALTVGPVRVVNVYVPNGERVDSEKFDYKLRWLQKLLRFLAEEVPRQSMLVVLGDFNVAPEGRDVHDPAAWEGQVLCSEPERTAFQRLLDIGLSDAFRLFDQPEAEYSWWDYRMGAFRRNRGLRIDHLLITEALGQACLSCRIDKTPRKNQRPSDHTPVIAEFRL